MLRDVREGLDDHEVRGALDGRGKPLPGCQRAVERRRDGTAGRDRGERGLEAPVHEDRRHRAPHERAQLGEREPRLDPRLRDDRLRRGRVGVDPLLRAAEIDRERDEALLGAVVDVALDPAQLRRLRLDRRRPALAESLDVLPQRRRRVDAQEALDHGAVQRDEPPRDRGGDRHEDEPHEERDGARRPPTSTPGPGAGARGSPTRARRSGRA